MKKLFLLYLLTLTGIFVINAGEANEQDYDIEDYDADLLAMYASPVNFMY